MSQTLRVMLLVETSMAYGREVLRGINHYVLSHQPWSMYLDLRELMTAPPAWLENWNGDGFISRSTTPELAEQLLRKKIPTVDLTDVHGDLGLPVIWTNHHAVGKMAAAHLLERGFQNLAFCGFSDHDWSAKRKLGFQESLEAKHSYFEYESPWTTTQSQTWEMQQQAISEWLSCLPKPVGILGCNDLRGQHLLDACRRAELSVPEEVAVIGVDDDELLCEFCDPPLSSVKPNAFRIGYQAAELLDQLMQGNTHVERQQLIEPIGVSTRQSTDLLAIDDPMVAAAVKYIRENACQGVSVNEVLREIPLSRSALERRFRKYLKRSPQAEIREVQLKRVKQLLAETDLALDRIAKLAGYEHPEYMSVVFKREIGQTPGEYRRITQSQSHSNPLDLEHFSPLIAPVVK